MSRQAYPKYKPSGIEWLGEVPEHWEVIRVKALEGNNASVVQTGPFGAQLHAGDYVDEGIPLILIRNVGDMRIDDTDIPMVSREDAQRLAMYQIKKGDIVFSRVGSIGRIALCTEREDGWLISGQMLRLRILNLNVHSRFSAYAFGCSAILTFVELQSVGSTRESINTDILRNMPIPMPPFNEQCSIAVFLDRETAHIDALIEKKQRQIELLQEKRAALISHAVTKGLDPNVKMKDSGIEWLGEIPEHWEIVRLGRKIMLQRGIDITKNEQNEGNVPVVSSGGVLSFHDTPYTTGPGVIVGRKGTAGAVYYIEQDFWPHDTTLWVKEFRGNHPRYVFYKLASMDLTSYDTGSANPTVNRNLLHPIPVSWPPGDEQRTIADYLDRETARIDAMIEQINKSIELLRKYRTALISAAVTGKIDVREEVS